MVWVVQRDAYAFETFSKAMLLSYFDKHFSTDAPDFTKISVHMNAQVPYNSTDGKPLEGGDAIAAKNQLVTDIKAARQNWTLSNPSTPAIPLTLT
jgi:hypothetical protein